MKITILAYVLMAVAATKPKDYDGEKSNYINVQKSSKQFKEQLQHQGYDAPSDKLSSDKDLPLDKDSFYFFSMHDYNKDGHLDGHELMLAFNGYHFAEGTENTDKIPLADLESMVDHALEEDDKDYDGRISWSEFLESQAYHHQLKQ